MPWLAEAVRPQGPSASARPSPWPSASSGAPEPLSAHRADDNKLGQRSLFPRIHPALLVVAGVCLVMLHVAMQAGLSGDVFYEVATGRWMLSHHALARADTFSYTIRGRPWLDEEWGFQVALAWLVAHVGAVSYWALSGGACCGAVLLSVGRWRMTGTGWLWAATLSVLAGAGLYEGISPRPQDLSYLFFAALLLMTTLARRRVRWLVAAPPLLLVWANIHGSFLLGLGVLGLELVWSLLPWAGGRADAERPLPPKPVAVTLAASFAATLVNPHGLGLVSYAFRVSSSTQLTSLITEWQSPDFHSLFLVGVIIVPVLFVVFLLAFTTARFPLLDLVLAGALFLATLHAIRFMPYYALAMGSLLCRWSPIKSESIKPTLVTLPLSLVALVALLAGPHPAAGAPATGNTSSATPVAATDFLKHQTGRVFTTYWWDDYLDYVGVPVFVDGRTDMYFGTDVLQTYVNVADLAVDPDTALRKWHVRWVMWTKGDPLAEYLAHDPAWRVALRINSAIVFQFLGRS